MRKRPFALLLFSIVIMGVAISLPVQVIYLHDFENIFQSLTLLNIFIMLSCALTSVSAYNAHKSIRYLLPVTIVAVIFNNWWVGYVGFNFNLEETSVASLAFLLMCSILLEKKTFKVLCNPKLKWWAVSKRAKIEIPVSLSPHRRGPPIIKRSYDISESGFYLQGLQDEELIRLNIGDKYNVCFSFSKILKIKCAAKIVRKSPENGSYPAGVGLQFVGIDNESKAALKKLSQENIDITF